MHTNCHTSRGSFGFGHRHHFDPSQSGYFRRPKYNVPLNSIDYGTYYEVHVFAVGFSKENIKLSVVEDVLYISGTKELPESGAPIFSRQEFPIKSFERMLNLQGQVDIASITAKQENGVLIITLPKTKESQTPAQEIQVS